MSLENELVSVVIPSYNHRNYLKRAIDSVLDQSYSNVECIVIDDGSQDGSYEHFHSVYAGNARVRLSARENRGAHATINEALQQARGEFLCILNSDDFFAPQRLERLVAAAKAHGKPFFAITALDVVDENEQPFLQGPAIYYRRVLSALPPGVDAAGFWAGNVAMTTSNFFFSRLIWEEVGPFRPLRYTHDWDWAMRASERFGFSRLNEPLMSYRVHGKNTISEPDIWSHICENAFIFASSLRRASLSSQEERTTITTPEIMSYLLKNESFLPLPTFYLLSVGKTDEELFEEISNGMLKADLQKIMEMSGVEFDQMLSAGHIQQQLTHLKAQPNGLLANCENTPPCINARSEKTLNLKRIAQSIKKHLKF